MPDSNTDAFQLIRCFAGPQVAHRGRFLNGNTALEPQRTVRQDTLRFLFFEQGFQRYLG